MQEQPGLTFSSPEKEIIVTPEERSASVGVVEALLQCMNAISSDGIPFTMDTVKSLFTADCKMTLNGAVLCQGHEGLLLHANDITAKLHSWRFNMPFQRTVVEPGEVVTYYTCDTVGLDGATGRAYDMAIYSLRDNRISGICEVVHFSGHDVSLDSF